MGFLSQVSSDRQSLPPRIVLLGGEKRGKSTFASQFPNPIFIPVKGETGIDDISVPKFPVANSYADVMAMLEELYTQKHEHQTIVLDSVSTLDPLAIDHILTEEKCTSVTKLGGGFGAQEGVIVQYWRQIFDALDALRSDRQMGCILIGHVKPTPKTTNDPMTDPYDTWRVELRESILGAMNRWADCILFCDFKKFARTLQKDEGMKKKIVHATSDRTRVLYTQFSPAHPGGGRGVYGRLPYELPLDYAAFAAAIAAAQ